MAPFDFDFELIVAVLKFILPPKNEEDERTVGFLICRFHETWLYLKSDPSRLDTYLSYLRRKVNLSGAVTWKDLFRVAERMEEHLDTKDILDG